MHIGENIRDIREKLGLSQKELAQKLKIRKATIACLEQRDELTDAAIKRTAEALGVSTDDIKNFEKDD